MHGFIILWKIKKYEVWHKLVSDHLMLIPLNKLKKFKEAAKRLIVTLEVLHGAKAQVGEVR